MVVSCYGLVTKHDTQPGVGILSHLCTVRMNEFLTEDQEHILQHRSLPGIISTLGSISLITHANSPLPCNVTRLQIANICWITEKARESQKNIYFCIIDYAKAFDCVDHKKLCKILKQMECRPPYLPPEKPVCRSRSYS